MGTTEVLQDDITPAPPGDWGDLMDAVKLASDAVDALILGADDPMAIVSPGYLAIGYGNNFRRHKMRVRLTYGTDVNNYGQMLLDADALGSSLAYVLTTSFIVDEWYAYDSDGHLLYGTLLPAPYAGRINVVAEQSNSETFTITGRGASTVGGLPNGEALARWFPDGTSIVIPRGYKYANLPAEPQMMVLAQTLASNAHFWADYYGHKAGVRQFAPFQYNAAVQRKAGK